MPREAGTAQIASLLQEVAVLTRLVSIHVIIYNIAKSLSVVSVCAVLGRLAHELVVIESLVVYNFPMCIFKKLICWMRGVFMVRSI